MQSNSFRKRRHGKIEELDVLDLDPYHSVPQDAIIGSPTTKGVVFVGPVGVGKTTCVETLSTVLPIMTEVKGSENDEFIPRWKTTTTVGIDYGIWKRDDGTEIGLFGTAGQDRFESTRAALNNPEAGVVLWLYGDPTLIEEQLEQWIPEVKTPLKKGRLCIALNFVEIDEATITSMTKTLLTEQLTKVDLGDGAIAGAAPLVVPPGMPPIQIMPPTPVVVADPRIREDVARVVELAIRSNS